MPISGTPSLVEVLKMLGVTLPPPTPTPDMQPGMPGYDPTTFANRIDNPSVMDPTWLNVARTGVNTAKRVGEMGKGLITGGSEEAGPNAENLGAILGALGPLLGKIVYHGTRSNPFPRFGEGHELSNDAVWTSPNRYLAAQFATEFNDITPVGRYGSAGMGLNPKRGSITYYGSMDGNIAKIQIPNNAKTLTVPYKDTQRMFLETGDLRDMPFNQSVIDLIEGARRDGYDRIVFKGHPASNTSELRADQVAILNPGDANIKEWTPIKELLRR